MALPYAQWVVRWRWAALLIALVIAGFAASGARYLGFSSDYRVFFSKENPQLNAFETLQNTYTKNDNAMIVVTPKSGKVFSPEILSAIEDITHEAWQIPYSIRVDSITNFQHTWAREDDLVVEDLVKDAMSLSPEQLRRIQKVALAEPLLNGKLINPDSTVTAVNVTINLPGKSMQETPDVVSFIREMADRYREKYPDIEIALTGVVFMNNAFNESGQGDMTTLVPIMYGLIIILLVVLLRSFTATVSTLAVIALSVVTGLGLAGWMGILLTPVSANAPTIILTLGVADSIHILVTFLHEMRAGRSKREAMIESLRINHQPVFITSVTTAIGFLSMNFSDSPPFRDLGNIVAMGVIAAYFYSVTLLPALITLLPVKVSPHSEGKAEWIDALAEFVIRNRSRLYKIMLAVIVLLVAMIPRLEIDERFNEYFDTRYQFRLDNDYVVENLSGFESIEYSLGAGESGGISNPEYLETVDAFAEWYRKQPHVMHVDTLTDIMKRLNKNMHGDDPEWFRLPDERELAAQYLLLYELSLPFGLDLNNQINIDKSSTRFTAIVDNISTHEALDLEERAQAWLKAHAPESMRTPGSSPLIMFSHIAWRNTQAMMTGTVLALVLISVTLMLALRSRRFGFISMIPNLAPVLMTFGVWAATYKYVGLSVSVVAPVALGIIVDDTVHFLSKYLRARRERNQSAEEAVRYSFHTVGNALWITSLVLVAGFSVLSFSGFSMNSHLGMLTVIGIVCALVADFLFLPPLLIKLEEKQNEKNVLDAAPAT